MTEFQEFKLQNGLSIILKEYHDLPIVSSMMWYKVGSRNEITGQTGISHFLEHLMFKGTNRFKKGEIDLITTLNGGSNNAFTWLDCTAYYFTFASDRWEIALEIEANRMRNNAFLPEEIEAERGVILSEWQMGKDNPEENLSDLLTATAIQAHPYHHPIIGWKQDIENLSPEELKAYYNTYYHPNLATLVLVGDFETELILKKVKELFEHIPAGPPAPKINVIEPLQEGERRVILKKEDASVPRLQLLYPVPEVNSDDFYALTILDHILSNGFSSILNQSIVEEKHLATSIDSYFFATRDPFLMGICADLNPSSSIEDVELAIEAEILNIQNGSLEKKHLEKAIHQVISQHHFSHETCEGQANFVGEFAVITDWKKASSYLDNLKKVSLTDIQRVASKYLVNDKKTAGWLVPSQPELSTPSKPVMKKVNYNPTQISSNASVQIPTTIPIIPEFKVTRKKLDNGFTILAHNNHSPFVKIQLFCQAGTLLESANQSGIANLTSELLLKGTKQSNAKELADKIESLGGTISTSTNMLGMSLNIKILSNYLPIALSVIHECISMPVFNSEELEKEKRVILNSIKSNYEDPNFVAKQAFKQLIYQNHPAQRDVLGEPESIHNLTSSDLLDFYHQYFSPAQCILSIAGGFDTQILLDKCGQLFSQWNPPEKAKFQLPPEAIKQQEKLEKTILLPGKEQVHIYLGHLGITRNNPDFYALEVMDTILGSGPGFTSRIPARLRDKEGLAYTTFSSITSYANLFSGTFVAYIGTDLKNKNKCINGFLEELENICTNEVSDEELTIAKSYLTGNCVFNYETCSQMTSFMIQQEIFKLSPNYIEEYPQNIQTITIEDVSRVAKKYLDYQNYSLAITQPK